MNTTALNLISERALGRAALHNPENSVLEKEYLCEISSECLQRSTCFRPFLFALERSRAKAKLLKRQETYAFIFA
jgi:hypothetical protein